APGVQAHLSRHELACNFKINEQGEVLEVPENRELLQAIDKSKSLNPHQLLQIAAKLGENKSQLYLAERLFLRAITSLAADSKVKEAMQAIKDRPMNWSIWGDVWNAVIDAATKLDAWIFGEPPASICDTRCAFFLLVEKCPGWKHWHVIG